MKQNSNKSKILLAEDDKFISRAFSDGLSRAGFNVVAAYDGIETLEKIKTEKPDLILLDIIMPKKNGFEVLEEMNKEEMTKMMNDENYKRIPVIAFTNLDQEDDMRRAKSLGVVDYLVKANFSMNEVIEKIKTYL